MHYKDYYVPGYCSMRNHLSEDASSSNWPLFYGDRALTTNGQYCNGFVSRGSMDAYPGYDKDAVKQKMLEHEAIFKNQVQIFLLFFFRCFCFEVLLSCELRLLLHLGFRTSPPLQNPKRHDARS